MKKILGRLINEQMKRAIRVAISKTDLTLAKIFSKSDFLASFYYCFINPKFRREHKAALLGKIHYWNHLKETNTSSPLLRRNIHRIEKGLIMRPRREIFATNYIEETVSCLANCLSNQSLCPEEKRWAMDVLTRYFEVSGEAPSINCAKEEYKKIVCQEQKVTNPEKYIPYRRRNLPKSDITFDKLQELFRQRRSVRWYLDTPVSTTTIRKAINAASFAPSACNRQPFEFIIINDKQYAKEIADCAMGTVGFSHNLPCLIVVTGCLDAYPAERDRHVIYIDAALASMQLMLALETLGLSSCPINWPDIEQREKKLHKKLKIPNFKRVIMLLAVGFADPDGEIPYSQKKSDVLLVKEHTQ